KSEALDFASLAVNVATSAVKALLMVAVNDFPAACLTPAAISRRASRTSTAGRLALHAAPLRLLIIRASRRAQGRLTGSTRPWCVGVGRSLRDDAVMDNVPTRNFLNDIAY